MTTATIGLRAKTGRAIAVVLSGSTDAPAFVLRREISLVDHDVPETAQPYHVLMDLPWIDVGAAAKPIIAAIERVAASRLRELIDELQSQRLSVRAIGVVGSPDRDLARIGNPHIRAHAAEGSLFRQVLETAARAVKLHAQSFTEKDLRDQQRSFASRLKRLGADAGAPWRGDEKCAAIAACLAMQRK